MDAFLYACEQGHLDVVRILFINGANILQQNSPNEQTALMLVNRYADALEYRLNQGTDMNVRYSKFRTPLMYAISSGNVNVRFALP